MIAESILCDMNMMKGPFYIALSKDIIINQMFCAVILRTGYNSWLLEASNINVLAIHTCIYTVGSKVLPLEPYM